MNKTSDGSLLSRDALKMLLLCYTWFVCVIRFRHVCWVESRTIDACFWSYTDFIMPPFHSWYCCCFIMQQFFWWRPILHSRWCQHLNNFRVRHFCASIVVLALLHTLSEVFVVFTCQHFWSYDLRALYKSIFIINIIIIMLQSWQFNSCYS